MKKERKIYTLRVTERELFAVTEVVNRELELDRERQAGSPGLPLLADERNALHGVIRKAEAAISEHHAVRSRA